MATLSLEPRHKVISYEQVHLLLNFIGLYGVKLAEPFVEVEHAPYLRLQ